MEVQGDTLNSCDIPKSRCKTKQKTKKQKTEKNGDTRE